MPQSCFRRARYAATISAQLLPPSRPIARRSQPSATATALAPLALAPLGQRRGRCCWSASALLMPNLSPPSSTASPSAADPFAAFVAEASQRFGIPASWIRAVMQVESVGDVRALSPKGAMGLMQIMPETWAALRSRYGLGADPYDAHDNILAGAAYLRELHDRYGSPGFLAAYNAGPARYEDHLATGRPLPAETQAYVAALAPVIGGGAIDDATVVNAVVRSWTEAPLFVVPAESSPSEVSGVIRSAFGPAIDRQSSAGLDGARAAIARACSSACLIGNRQP